MRQLATGMCQRPKAERRVGVAPLLRASDSPAPGESRMLEQPGKTKNTEELDDGFEVDVGVAGIVVGDLLLAVGEKLFRLCLSERCN